VTVSRAAGKLEAALRIFDLGSAVRGARAVDVGASTGGFTATLLAHGAAHVLAVDVGKGQLAPALRADPRVTSLEETDWKRLPLGQAEGPFDFFTVDVSFVAARNMLRGLAFRLRAGASGVVLVKPQFELADRQVRGGRVDDANLRRTALEKVRQKAESLGFVLLGHADSPVAGGEGTVEILAHLRFERRPAALPAPGEKKPARPAPARADADVEASLRWFAVAAPGLEEAVRREVAALPGAANVRAVVGGVEWSGEPEVGLRANLWLRVATRVLARVGEVEASDFGKLRRRAAGLPWRRFLAAGTPLAIRASTSRCRLYHTGAIAETLALAIGDAVPGARAADPGEGPPLAILARGEDDRFTLSADASGELLHRRGARLEAGKAPLRETLAAGLLALAEWRPDVPLYDPMCGAGTIPIEACAIALDAAPGAARSFAIESWPIVAADPALATRLRDEARARLRPAPPAALAGSDRDPRVIEMARRNAERAGFGAHIAFACADLADARPPATPGLVLLNPPYGHRMAAGRSRERHLRDLGRALRTRFPGWRAGVLVPAGVDASALGLPDPSRFPIVNGGLRVTLIVSQLS